MSVMMKLRAVANSCIGDRDTERNSSEMTNSERSCHYLVAAFITARETPGTGRAYQYLATDVIARFRRLDGFRVHYVVDAQKLGTATFRDTAPDADRVRGGAQMDSVLHECLQTTLTVPFDRPVRVPEPAHRHVWQALRRSMLTSGDLYVDTYAGWYSDVDGTFHAGADIRIENDGSCTAASSDVPVRWIQAPCNFFRLSAFRNKLLTLHENFPDFVTPQHRRPEILRSISDNLPDIPISLAIDSEGETPEGFEDRPGGDLHSLVDQLVRMAENLSGDTDNCPNQPSALHAIGPDDIWRHTLLWPAILLSSEVGIYYRVVVVENPLTEVANGTAGDSCAADPFELLRKYGTDRVRYLLLRETPFGSDREYSHHAIVNRTDADLAEALSTVAYSVLSLISKHCDGRVPPPSRPSARDMDLIRDADDLLAHCRTYIDTHRFHLVLEDIWSVLESAGSYFHAEKPWILRRTDPQRMNTVLYTVLDTLRTVGILIQPIIPETATRLLDQLAVPHRNFDALDHRIEPGTMLPAPRRVFPRYSKKHSKNIDLSLTAPL